MADTPNDTSMLPPKLDLRKRTTVPASTPEAAAPTPPAAETGAAPAAETMRVNLPASESPPPAVTPTPVAAPKPILAGPHLKPAAPLGTVRLQARPKTLTPSPSSGSTPAAGPTQAPPSAAATTLSARPQGLAPLNPAAVPEVPRRGAETLSPAAAKRETSRIPLESATGLPGAPMGAKTIRIQPAAGTTTPGGPAPTSEDEPQDAQPPDPKRQTSRISLESALGANENDKSTGPKTIRLKRPSEAPTVRVKQAPTEAADGGELRKTAPIESAADEGPATQKKTIKVKRPSQRHTMKSVSVKRGTGSEAEGTATMPHSPPSSRRKQVVDSAHWTFITASIAAMILCFVLIYVLCAQVLGPNISLTELSYAAPDAELPWPERIPRQ